MLFKNTYFVTDKENIGCPAIQHFISDKIETYNLMGVPQSSEPLFWIRNDWLSVPCGMQDKRRVYPELVVGKHRNTTSKYDRISVF